MAQRLYHVASERYQAGDPLLCWDALTAAGVVGEADWRWADAPVGYDGDVVCCFATLDEAREYRDEHGGRILVIDAPDNGDLGIHESPYGGYIQPRRRDVAEGFPCFTGGIPAAWIAGEVAP
jgi:hypothetical protein